MRSRARPELVAAVALLLPFACTGELVPSGDDDSGDDEPTFEERCNYLPKRLRRLSPEQFDRTVAAVIPSGFPKRPSAGFAGTLQTSARFGGSAETLGMTSPHVEDLLEVTGDLSDAIASDPEHLVSCDVTAESCAHDLFERVGELMFRRPLGDEELGRFEDFFASQSAEYGRGAALRLTLQAILLSPSSLYRAELGKKSGKELLPHELASAISYAISDGPPDAEILADAESGSLSDPEIITAHIQRLLSRPETSSGILRYFVEYARAASVTTVAREEALFPEFTPSIRGAMLSEFEHFVRYLLWEANGTTEDFFSAPYTFVNSELAQHYELEGPASGDEFTLVEAPGRRSGYLTQGVFLTQAGHSDRTSIVLRGTHIILELLCSSVGSPPADVNDDLPVEVDEGPTTQRDRLEMHRKGTSCKGCHEQIDPLGYPFEAFDAVGRPRTEEQGLSIDTSGGFPGPDGMIPVADVHEFARELGRSPRVQACFMEHVRLYLDGTDEAPDGCPEEELPAGDTPILEAFEETLTSERFYLRRRAD